MTVFKATMIGFVLLAMLITVAIVWAFRTTNDNRETCHSLGGRWLDRYELCISNDAVIPMPS